MTNYHHTVAATGRVHRPSHPGASLAFIFSTLSFLFWANILGYLGPGGSLAVGLVQLAVYGSYLAGSVILLKRGDDLDGNVFMVFAAFFGGVGGMLNIGSTISVLLGVPFSPQVGGICWIMAGIYLLACSPASLRTNLVDAGVYILGAVALLTLGFAAVGFLPGTVLTVAAWMLFVVGVLALVLTVSIVGSHIGYRIPMGPALLRTRAATLPGSVVPHGESPSEDGWNQSPHELLEPANTDRRQ
ncbi:hypothetical protein J2T10_002674 [Paenarthrobacter nicotinovorans]|jgi:hypothetical protein|uniref:DUF308 domain-containing protein n=1 Tax=Paenarthrobacter nicotinovorans TaxID=29320 RepID=A0ABT9TRE0_PAENI|nr:hypothetical protein [Paenarthrobacter nicotinovorans]MDQ0103017.1 hypothetical protein [Paenarthrobacter nicotinovorans]GAT89411.1 hypothetical protein CVCC1112_4070 [Paenarthrobacter nicotinovorans]